MAIGEPIPFLAGFLPLAGLWARSHHHAAAGAERELLHEAEDLLADVALAAWWCDTPGQCVLPGAKKPAAGVIRRRDESARRAYPTRFERDNSALLIAPRGR